MPVTLFIDFHPFCIYQTAIFLRPDSIRNALETTFLLLAALFLHSFCPSRPLSISVDNFDLFFRGVIQLKVSSIKHKAFFRICRAQVSENERPCLKLVRARKANVFCVRSMASVRRLFDRCTQCVTILFA